MMSISEEKTRTLPSGACKGVDVDYMVYFKIQRYSIGIRYTLGKLAQANSIGIVFGKNGVVLVHPVDRLP